MIDSFSGKFRFLSNFYPCEINFEGKKYITVEHAFQAAKTLDDLEREIVRKTFTPGQAKRAGRTVTLRKDWDDIKIEIMSTFVQIKFQNPTLVKLLKDTFPDELVEGNTWNDTFWGVCNGVGENNLGKILMRIREGEAVAVGDD